VQNEPSGTGQVLVAHDNDAECIAISGALEADGFKSVVTNDGTEAVSTLRCEMVRAAVLSTHLKALTRIRSCRPSLPIVMLVNGSGIHIRGTNTVKMPLHPLDPAAIVAAVRQQLGSKTATGPGSASAGTVATWYGMVGYARGDMRAVMAQVARTAPKLVTVLIQGETGTGKELLARAVHSMSGRKGPFVPINCADLSGELFQSEFWGHTLGAFTGAVAAKPGLVDAASGGTLFLDEISLLPASQQGYLLRFLEDGMVRPVGSTKLHRANVRVIAASNTDLHQSDFRPDLHHRLAVVVVRLPPLRRRRRDIPALVRHFLALYAGRHSIDPVPKIEAKALQDLTWEDWPGNVRELGNAIERAVLYGGPVLEAKDFALHGSDD